MEIHKKLKTIILGKRSFLSRRLDLKISSSVVFNYNEFKSFILNNKEKFNLIINSFYPSSKLDKIKSYNDFYNQSIGNISEVLDKIDPKKINKVIYTSSASIYGSISERQYENDNNNRSLYSSTKLLNEILLNNFCKKKKIQLIIARVFNMYGADDNFSIIQKLIKANKNNQKIIINNEGNMVRDFIHVDDVCKIYSKCLKLKKSLLFDVGTGYGTKIIDILSFLKISKKNIIFKKNKIDEIDHSIANISNIKKNFKNFSFLKIENFLKKETKFKKNKNHLIKVKKDSTNTINNYLNGSVVYGCGFAGKKIAQKLIKLNNRSISYFVDDNKNLIGKKYLGKKIISCNDLITISKKKIISNIIIAIPSMPDEKLMSLHTKLFPLTLSITALPNKQNLLKKNEVTIQDLKNLELSDILNRKIFNIDKKSVKNFNNKCILVTGGAGSIGSEISQQLLKANPSKLIIIDNSEYSLFKIKQKLGTNRNIKYILLDINRKKQIKKIIKINKVKYIFHAAAYKHVNFLEENLISAVRNNIISTISLLESIKNTDINLIIISTDKAVEPINVLGMTKRASEIIALTMSKEADFKSSNISIVRFGNVFGSAGSAIEIFKNQIKNDEPITLTNIKMKRFFMSIREACNLVLKASQLKHSSSIFILKMGKSIKIIDIINKMFDLMKKENQKLKIKIIGKFKAEKINEKLTNKKLKNTSINEISITRDKILSYRKVQSFLKNLDLLLKNLDEKNIKTLLKRFTH